MATLSSILLDVASVHWTAQSELALYLRPTPLYRAQTFLKRGIEVPFAAAGLIFAAPVMFVISLLIWTGSSGPVFYRTYRVGKGGRLFRFYKFRTMVHNGDQLLDQVRSSKGHPVLLKFENDHRVTRSGRWLRRYSFDELPQLWNILKGDMSLVGPRPPSVDEYQQLPFGQSRRMSVRPGLTGLWQITARGNPCLDTYLQLDCDYVDHWSLWLDFKIILQTIPAVLLGTGR